MEETSNNNQVIYKIIIVALTAIIAVLLVVNSNERSYNMRENIQRSLRLDNPTLIVTRQQVNPLPNNIDTANSKPVASPTPRPSKIQSVAPTAIATTAGPTFTGSVLAYTPPNYVKVATTGMTQGWQGIAVSSTGQYQTACANTVNGIEASFLYRSADYGITWSKTNEDYRQHWKEVALSADGSYQVAVAANTGKDTNNAMYSTDYGLTWTSGSSYIKSAFYTDVSISADAKVQVIACGSTSSGERDASGYIYISTNKGVDFTTPSSITARQWYGASTSGTGMYITAVADGVAIQTSNNYGVNFGSFSVVASGVPNPKWMKVAISSTGQYQSVSVSQSLSQLYTSSNYGFNWNIVKSSPTLLWNGIAMSGSGQYQFAAGYSSSLDDGTNQFTASNIYVSTDYGNSFTATIGPANFWYDVAVSDDASYIAATVEYYPYTNDKMGNIYVFH